MEQLTKNQAVATSQEAVQNQNEPQLRDENAHNDKSVHGVLNPTYQAGLRRDAVQPDIEAERKKRDEIEAGKSYCSRRDRKSGSAGMPRSEERFSRNAETDLVCRLLLEKKNLGRVTAWARFDVCVHSAGYCGDRMSKRILVVEDQPDNRQIIRDMLAHTDYELTEAKDGQQALQTITKQRPDLILMDIQLPIIDGYTATRKIKADPALRSIPIIAVTSYALRGEEKKAREAGCDDYVPKPFSPRQLLAKIRQHLSWTCRSPGSMSALRANAGIGA